MLGVAPPPSLGALKESFPVCKDGSGFKRKEAQGRGQVVKRLRAGGAENRENSSALVDAFLERNTQPCAGEAPLDDNAPTSFAGLIPRSSQQPLQQHHHQQGEQGHHQAALGGTFGQQRSVRTFEDITRQNGTRTVLMERPPADWTPPCLAPSLMPELTVLEAAGMDAAPGERQLAPSATAPMDWSIKTTIRFSSPLPFTVCEEAAAAPTRMAVEAQRAFAACAGTSMLSLQQQLLASLLSFQFPHDPGTSQQQQQQGGSMRPRSSTGSPAAAQLQRRQAWQAAFSSLYDSFRSGMCDAFYYISPEGSRRPFVAFFGAAGVGGRQRMHALMTRTTAGLRSMLERNLGMGLATPLMPDANSAAADDLASVPVEGTQSLAAFEGALRVHGLFDFLLNESFRCHGDDCDVPVLMAPTQFLHASMVSFQPRQLGSATPAALGAGGNALPSAARSQHRMELRGLLPPWVVDRLVGILAVAQDGNFSLAADTHPLTLALNWQPGGSSSSASQEASATLASDCAARAAGCLDAEEAQRWREAAPGLACNVLRELCCEGGVFVSRLRARTAERVAL